VHIGVDVRPVCKKRILKNENADEGDERENYTETQRKENRHDDEECHQLVKVEKNAGDKPKNVAICVVVDVCVVFVDDGEIFHRQTVWQQKVKLCENPLEANSSVVTDPGFKGDEDGDNVLHLVRGVQTRLPARESRKLCDIP